MQPEFFGESGADFSSCGAYRYRLWRRWSEGPSVAFIMLNPSTADEFRNDPTIERCHRRAVDMGYGALEVVNIFAYRATDPRELKKYPHPVGPDNDIALLQTANSADMVICAWGGHGDYRGRHEEVRKLLKEHAIAPHVLSLTAKGQPGHPLYLPYSRQPVPWTGF
ncbi:DUF1643 domain-containing protein [uncultured Sneathiella sp.]|uniref:DUF1643 domain-containing protein n=1 Tax=uncultured Sneathiella sp. TaxID=879315 RepID=UPI002597090E|nr:DUF1643 domain-containing protein [uncultured Sneathiella sp.]